MEKEIVGMFVPHTEMIHQSMDLENTGNVNNVTVDLNNFVLMIHK